MLLYIHVPFCRSKCRYCAFYSEPIGGGLLDEASERMQLWMDNVVLEMAQWGDRLAVPRADRIFGGGTPSLLPPSIIGGILNRAARCFRLDGAAEISMEANPESISRQLPGSICARGSTGSPWGRSRWMTRNSPCWDAATVPRM